MEIGIRDNICTAWISLLSENRYQAVDAYDNEIAFKFGRKFFVKTLFRNNVSENFLKYFEFLSSFGEISIKLFIRTLKDQSLMHIIINNLLKRNHL